MFFCPPIYRRLSNKEKLRRHLLISQIGRLDITWATLLSTFATPTNNDSYGSKDSHNAVFTDRSHLLLQW